MDRYTKVVLTVIAIALSVNAVEMATKSSFAQTTPEPKAVWISGINPGVILPISVEGLKGGNLPVVIQGATAPLMVRKVP